MITFVNSLRVYLQILEQQIQTPKASDEEKIQKFRAGVVSRTPSVERVAREALAVAPMHMRDQVREIQIGWQTLSDPISRPELEGKLLQLQNRVNSLYQDYLAECSRNLVAQRAPADIQDESGVQDVIEVQLNQKYAALRREHWDVVNEFWNAFSRDTRYFPEVAARARDRDPEFLAETGFFLLIRTTWERMPDLLKRVIEVAKLTEAERGIVSGFDNPADYFAWARAHLQRPLNQALPLELRCLLMAAALDWAERKETALEQVHRNGLFLERLNEELRKDEEIVKAAVSQNFEALQWVDRKAMLNLIRDQAEVYPRALRYVPRGQEINFLSDAVKVNDKVLLLDACRGACSDETLMSSLVHQNTRAFLHAHEKLRKDREFTLELIRDLPEVLPFIDPIFWDNRQFNLDLAIEHNRFWRFINPRFGTDSEFLFELSGCREGQRLIRLVNDALSDSTCAYILRLLKNRSIPLNDIETAFLYLSMRAPPQDPTYKDILVRFLEERPDIRKNMKQQYITITADSGHREATAMLARSLGDDESCKVAVMRAIEKGSLMIVRDLLGIELNLPPPTIDQALAQAAKGGHLLVVQELIYSRYRPFVSSEGLKKALDEAKGGSHRDVETFLVQVQKVTNS